MNGVDPAYQSLPGGGLTKKLEKEMDKKIAEALDGVSAKSAYQSYVDTTTDNPPKTEAEWVSSLKGEDGVSLGEVAIADNLTTDDSTKVLSAKQGYLLGQKVNDVDDVPTAGSEKFVKSGGVQNELALGAVYDVSAKNPTAGINNDGKWESLSTLLSDANLNTLIPTAYRKGGMSIKFVQSSDNKYIQARCMAQNFTTDVTQWQGVDDIPIKGSHNLIKSSAVASALNPNIPLFEIGTIVAGRNGYDGNSIDTKAVRTTYFIRQNLYNRIYFVNPERDALRMGVFYYDKDYNHLRYANWEVCGNDYTLIDVPNSVYIRVIVYHYPYATMNPSIITENVIRFVGRDLKTSYTKIEALSNLNNYNEGFVLGSRGVLQQNANYITTPYIPCTPQDTVRWYWKNLDYLPTLYLFDENKNYLDYYGPGGVTVTSRTVNLNSDTVVAYIRVSFKPSQLDAAYISINGEIVWYANNIYRGDIDTIKQDVQSLSEAVSDIPQLTLLYGEKLIKRTYTGERISLFDDNSVNYERKQFSTIPFESTQNQSFAINGEYIIFLFDSTMNAVMYRLTDNTKVCDLSFPTDSTYGGSHNNACGFGMEKYNDSSVFPMFYISQFNVGTKGYLAYDLVTNSDGTYTPKLVQIIVPSSELRNNDSFGLGSGDYCIDKDNDKLYRIGYKQNQIGGNVMVSKFNMPKKEDGIDFVSSTGDTIKVVTLDISDMEDSFNIGNSLLQDNCYYKGNIIKTGSALTFIDLATKTVRSIPVNVGNGFGESEGVDVYMDRLIINYWDKQGIFEFKF